MVNSFDKVQNGTFSKFIYLINVEGKNGAISRSSSVTIMFEKQIIERKLYIKRI